MLDGQDGRAIWRFWTRCAFALLNLRHEHVGFQFTNFDGFSPTAEVAGRTARRTIGSCPKERSRTDSRRIGHVAGSRGVRTRSIVVLLAELFFRNLA